MGIITVTVIFLCICVGPLLCPPLHKMFPWYL